MSGGQTLRTLYKSQLGGEAYQLTRSPEATPFWEGCRAKRLMLPRCQACERTHFYPRRFCPFCDSTDITWIQASGKGAIYSFATVRQPIEAAFASLVPYVIGIVELEEGIRMLSRIAGSIDQVNCARPVHVTFEEVSPTLTVPVFALT